METVSLLLFWNQLPGDFTFSLGALLAKSHPGRVSPSVALAESRSRFRLERPDGLSGVVRFLGEGAERRFVELIYWKDVLLMAGRVQFVLQKRGV